MESLRRSPGTLGEFPDFLSFPLPHLTAQCPLPLLGRGLQRLSKSPRLAACISFIPSLGPAMQTALLRHHLL